jgi:hypothetical protein
MKRTYAWREGKLVELTPAEIDRIPNVQDDVPEFRSPDGVRISGRAQWKEHLKRTGTVEMGHSDMKSRQAQWEKRRSAFQAKVQSGGEHVKEVVPPTDSIERSTPTQISVEMANRLYNRPMPDRKTMIKLTLETAREIAKRR